MRRIVFVVPAVLATLAGCGSISRTAEIGTIQQQGSPIPSRGRIADHVVIVSVDGLRPDAIEKYELATLQKLMREGRYSLSARTIAISSTLPSHTSMLSGVDSDVHGITWNSDKTKSFGRVKVPTVFSLAHDAGYTSAAFFSKTKFHHITGPEAVEHIRGPSGGPIPWNSAKTVDLVLDHLETTRPNLTFVHLSDADFAGHTFGWMGWMYGLAARDVDKQIARLLEGADAAFGERAYTLIVTSDHGGHGKRHGTTDSLDVTIPWIVWGAGVRPGSELTGIRTMDTAATTIWMLGLDAPRTWVGRPVTDAFAGRVASDR